MPRTPPHVHRWHLFQPIPLHLPSPTTEVRCAIGVCVDCEHAEALVYQVRTSDHRAYRVDEDTMPRLGRLHV